MVKTDISEYYPCRRVSFDGMYYKCRYTWGKKHEPLFSCIEDDCKGQVPHYLLLCSKHLGVDINPLPLVTSRYAGCEVCKWCFKPDKRLHGTKSLMKEQTSCKLKRGGCMYYCQYGYDLPMPFYKCSVDKCTYHIDQLMLLCEKHTDLTNIPI
jgi:hypothetical protein